MSLKLRTQRTSLVLSCFPQDLARWVRSWSGAQSGSNNISTDVVLLRTQRAKPDLKDYKHMKWRNRNYIINCAVCKKYPRTKNNSLTVISDKTQRKNTKIPPISTNFIGSSQRLIGFCPDGPLSTMLKVKPIGVLFTGFSRVRPIFAVFAVGIFNKNNTSFKSCS